MRFELTKEYLDALRSAIAQQDVAWMKEHVFELHHADIGGIVDELEKKKLDTCMDFWMKKLKEIF